MLPAQPVCPGRPAGDRGAWQKLAAQPALSEIIPQAEELLASPLPDQPDDLYLDFSRTGKPPQLREGGLRAAGPLDAARAG